MKIRIFFIFFLTILIFLSKNALAKIDNKIAIKVENKIITSYEIKNKILTSLVLSNSEINQKNINKLKKQAIDSLIQLKLKKIEIDKYNIKLNNRVQVNEYLNSISSNNIQGLEEKFLNYNLDFELFLDEVETQTMWRNLIYKIYSKKIQIDENIVDQELESYIQENSSIKEYRISEIEILIDENEKNKEKILNIEKEIKELGFENAVLKYSISSSVAKRGDLGWINTKSLSDEISSILKEMIVGQISKPIIRQKSVIFLKVKDIRNSKVENLNLTDLKNRIINQKKNELGELYSISHLSKIRNSSLIEYK